MQRLCGRIMCPMKPKYLQSGPLWEEFADPSNRGPFSERWSGSPESTRKLKHLLNPKVGIGKNKMSRTDFDFSSSSSGGLDEPHPEGLLGWKE